MKPPTTEPYYVQHGQACDDLVRCHSCQALCLVSTVLSTTPARGEDRPSAQGCKCGSRKFTEVRTLSTWEWLKIKLRLIRFPHREEFLKEFARG